MDLSEPVSEVNTVRCENPATRELLGHVPTHSADDARSAIREAREAQKTWSTTRESVRAKRILGIRDYLVDEADAIAEIISHDTGKTRIDALATEVMPSVLGASYYARNTRRFLRSKRIRGGSVVFLNKLSTVHRVPCGVVGVISPWNYPLGIPMHEIIPALLAGNGVVFKTAPETQMVGRKIETIVAAGGLPQGLFAHLNLPGSTAGDVFLEPGGVDKLFFTGSVAVGKLLMAVASKTLTPVSLELGGNDAMLVCADADLERAVNGAVWAGLQNSGQSCAGVERVYVHQDIYPAFMALLKKRVESLRLGVDRDHGVDIGALCTERQVIKVRQQIDQALALGARVHARAEVPPEYQHGNFLPVTVLADVSHEMAVMKEETFGPVLAVMAVPDMDQALRLANDSMLGLTGSVWSRDTRAAVGLGTRIRAGVITINDHLLSHGLAETPWGGFKESGIGRSHGRQGFDEMTETQVVVAERLPFLRRNLFWHPYSPSLYDGLRGLLDLLYARNPRRRLRGLRRLLVIVPRMFRE